MTVLAQAAPQSQDVPDAARENLVDLIQRLSEPPEPAPIAMTPQTPGWLVLGGFFLVLVSWLLWRWLDLRRRNAYRRAALAELERAKSDPAQIAEILRRTALAAYPREQVAGLSGSPWLEFLDNCGAGVLFGETVGQELLVAPYRKDAPASVDLFNAAEQWVRKHRVEKGSPSRARFRRRQEAVT
ncbi:DUF4381 domain-containing protein [Qingshengfaniella alkalisoli]|uniref:DUF4381 domain-containing protein n=1 Tax=Qingshengfaniella alkalisoli TaxID=2599296 RepID=A0A5B8I7P6_9RHOB|nr:DUF4381 domain-containing protein [Qingshengfaniella alkalisoli]QDY69619.1 DUF4381 domain-containing protein [Qingshengfaniella alkalisoli]